MPTCDSRSDAPACSAVVVKLDWPLIVRIVHHSVTDYDSVSVPDVQTQRVFRQFLEYQSSKGVIRQLELPEERT